MSANTWQQAEGFFLLMVALFLPAFEAPKNIALVFYLGFWTINRYRCTDWGGRWSGFDSWTLAMIASAYVAAAWGAFVPAKGLAAANDVLTYGLLFMAVRRADYGPALIYRVLAVVVMATLATLAWGYWGLWGTHERQTLGLHSVGHVNHSAIYMAIVFTVALVVAWVLRGRARVWAGLAACLLWASLYITQARGAIIPVLAFLLLWFVVRFPQPRDWVKPLLALLLLLGLTLLANPGLLEKTRGNLGAGQMGSYRPALAKVSLIAAREFPLFGVGVTNFGKITPELAAAWQDKNGHWFAADQLFFASHAHGLYTNTLAERGALGVLPVLGLLILIVMTLVAQRPQVTAAPLAWVLWGGALGATTITVVGGLFNTTLHHEHALLSLLLVGLWLSARRSAAD